MSKDQAAVMWVHIVQGKEYKGGFFLSEIKPHGVNIVPPL